MSAERAPEPREATASEHPEPAAPAEATAPTDGEGKPTPTTPEATQAAPPAEATADSDKAAPVATSTDTDVAATPATGTDKSTDEATVAVPAAAAATSAEPTPVQAADATVSAPEPAPEPKEDPRLAELETLRGQRNELAEKLLRTAADFDNYRKRTRRELEDAKLRGRDETLRDLLPVFDNLERAVTAAGGASEATAVLEGVRMVLKLFEDIVQRMGLERVGAVGTRFDPAVHEALQQQETDAHPPGTVITEVSPGYVFGKRLLRAALVIVARKPSEPRAPSSAETIPAAAPSDAPPVPAAEPEPAAPTQTATTSASESATASDSTTAGPGEDDGSIPGEDAP